MAPFRSLPHCLSSPFLRSSKQGQIYSRDPRIKTSAASDRNGSSLLPGPLPLFIEGRFAADLERGEGEIKRNREKEEGRYLRSRNLDTTKNAELALN